MDLTVFATRQSGEARERSSIEAIAEALENARVRYLIVGDVAVLAHGVTRFKPDLDLVLDPSPESLRRAVAALQSLNYRPRAPVAFEDFADARRRSEWVRDKGLTVFSLSSDRHPATEVDLFVESPFDFETVYARALRLPLHEQRVMTFVSRADLIAMKRAAGRDVDLNDVEALSGLHGEGGRRE